MITRKELMTVYQDLLDIRQALPWYRMIMRFQYSERAYTLAALVRTIDAIRPSWEAA